MASLAASDHRAPGLSRLLREGGSLLALRTRSVLALTGARRGVGHGRPVMVIPGFLATDFSTLILRRALEEAGYRVHGWGLGMNLGARTDMLDRLEYRLNRASRRGPVSLVGWSLGGLYARELARHRAPVYCDPIA